MALKEIKSRWAGKCAKCGRDIREGWDIIFDSDSKEVYCKPCGSPMLSSASGSGTAITELIELDMKVDTSCSQCGTTITEGMKAFYSIEKREIYCEACSVVQAEIANPATRSVGETKLALSAIETVTEEIQGLVNMNNVCLAALSDDVKIISNRLEVVQTNIITLVAKKAREKTEVGSK